MCESLIDRLVRCHLPSCGRSFSSFAISSLSPWSPSSSWSRRLTGSGTRSGKQNLWPRPSRCEQSISCWRSRTITRGSYSGPVRGSRGERGGRSVAITTRYRQYRQGQGSRDQLGEEDEQRRQHESDDRREKVRQPLKHFLPRE